MAHSNIAKVQRYIAFIRHLQNSQPVTPETLRKKLLGDGFKASESTFYKLKDELITMGMVIKTIDHEGVKKYMLEDPSGSELDEILHFLGVIEKGNLASKGMRNSPSKIYDRLRFEDTGVVRGIEHLSQLVEAISNNQKVTLYYQRYGADKPKALKHLEPHYLKEHQGRWYLYSKMNWGDGRITHAIDSRLKKIELEDEIFDFDSNQNLFPEISSIVGLNYNQGEDHWGIQGPVKVVFELSPLQQNYVEDLPLHFTQQFIGHSTTKKDWKRYSIYVYPNYELAQSILRLGREVKLIEPDFFSQYLKDIISEMHGFYAT